MEEEKIRCPKCNSTLAYIRIKTNEICCRSCGHIEKVRGEKYDKK
jgi:uncharacterized protein YbaR (Trm112 family)